MDRLVRASDAFFPPSQDAYTHLMSEILTVDQMYAADRWAIARGISGITLMEAAGKACADAIKERFDRCQVAVLCGPGNNGGDGFVVARLLRQAGWGVSIFLMGEREALQGDAGHVAHRWNGPVYSLTPDAIDNAELIVDALFGAGLSNDLEGTPKALVDAATARGTPVMAVDVPSGIDGDTGRVRGAAFRAAMTVTFFRKKPAHLLLPGRNHCGEIIVADIGIESDALGELDITLTENDPSVWQAEFPDLDEGGHKYARGHAVSISGGASATGAARLGARAALRIGAGLVTVASPPNALQVNAMHLTAIMLQRFEGAEGLTALLDDKRKNAILVGPGNGVGAETRENVQAALTSGAATVLDADALTSFEEIPRDLFVAIENYFAGPVVLTPHEGEFKRLFPDLDGSKLERASAAAKIAHAVIVLKGPDTIIASPDGRAVINSNAGPELGTAGSGDVLAGMITGLLAQGMPAFSAAAAAVWLHGEAGRRVGRGLIAEDLPEQLPTLLQELSA
ncbi:bifunctional NAD(P)H-hydrate repair enzyme Nnr [Rhodobiaceae bacterium]|nr:bifunctional NAD(P)H-hydrate repair enzyme Nnr [Rhodobiaceae bacterium]